MHPSILKGRSDETPAGHALFSTALWKKCENSLVCFFFSSGNRKSELTFSKTAETECCETSFFKFAEINDPLPHIVILTPDQHASTWIRCQHQ